MPQKWTPRKYWVPADPFVRLIDEWVNINGGRTGSNTGNAHGADVNPMRKVSALVWPDSSAIVADRILRRLRNQTYINFDLADRIVTRLFGPFRWIVDAELREIYQNVDLAALDRADPCDVIAAA